MYVITTSYTFLLSPTISLNKIGVLISFYMLVMRAGHLYCVICVILTQIELFRELVNVRYVEAKEKKMPLFRTIQWSWFVVAMLYIYIESLHIFWVEREQMQYITSSTRYLNYVIFALYCAVFITTVLTLKKGLIRFQISQMFWTIVTIGLVVIQCKTFATNTFNGLFWYWFPMATVVMNDVSAYFCGITMGRKFIKASFLTLSPNKTWEGFIGAGVLTLIFSFYFPAIISNFTWLTCPAEGLYWKPFPPALHCELNPIFIPRLYTIRNFLDLGGTDAYWRFTLKPIQLHGLAYGIFASLVSPFGGNPMI
jgi:phosphatidate cytidylyltransferase